MSAFPDAPLFYVYTYASSLDGKVFYVGKGSDERHIQHIREARRKDIQYPNGSYRVPTRVASTVRSIWQSGGKIIIRKPYKALSESEALETERSLIAYYGDEQLVNNRKWNIVHNI